MWCWSGCRANTISKASCFKTMPYKWANHKWGIYRVHVYTHMHNVIIHVCVCIYMYTCVLYYVPWLKDKSLSSADLVWWFKRTLVALRMGHAHKKRFFRIWQSCHSSAPATHLTASSGSYLETFVHVPCHKYFNLCIYGDRTSTIKLLTYRPRRVSRGAIPLVQQWVRR